MNLKQDFPIFEKNSNLIFVDNAATSQKPKVLIEALSNYYYTSNSNIGRGVYKLAELSQNIFDDSKKNISKFINTKSNNLIFTSGATESLNMIAYFIKQIIKPNSKILLSIYEHHSNLLVWQRLALENNLSIEFIKDENILMNPELLSDDIFHNIGLIALTHNSNVNGSIFPILKWINLSKKFDFLSVIDGAQGITSEILNLEQLNPDFYSFSAHKLYGPMGLGITYINSKHLNLEPYKLGGGMIEDVEEQSYELSFDTNRFEAGTPNVANIFAFSEVVNYLTKHDWPNLIHYTHDLNQKFFDKLSKLSFVKIISSSNKGNLTSFNIDGIHPHDVGTYLSSKNIAVRVGKHCAYPLHSHLNLNSSIRVSFAIYNNIEEIDIIINEIENCYKFFNRG